MQQLLPPPFVRGGQGGESRFATILHPSDTHLKNTLNGTYLNVPVSSTKYKPFKKTEEQCQRFGMDVDQWAERGYIDMIITGRGYDPFTMPDDLIRRGHEWGLPVYRCLSNSAIAPGAGSRHGSATGEPGGLAGRGRQRLA